MRTSLRIRIGAMELVPSRGEVVTLGRQRGSSIPLTHERVSRRHAVVRHEPDGWYFEDLGSMNGSFLGEEPVRRVRIDAAVAIRLGDRRNGPLIEFHPCRLPDAPE